MKVHSIEIGDIIEHGKISLNDKLEVPGLYKIQVISSGTDGFKLGLRSTTRWKEYMEWWEILKAQQENTIKIETSEGCVQDVKGMPDGYQYEIVECDKYGEPLPPPCPECKEPMELADEDVEGQGKTWVCTDCCVHYPESCGNCTIETPDPEKDCGSCPTPLTGEDLGIEPRS